METTTKHVSKESNILFLISITLTLKSIDNILIAIRRIGSAIHITIIEFLPRSSSSLLNSMVCEIMITNRAPLIATSINRNTFLYITDAFPVAPFLKTNRMSTTNKAIANPILTYTEILFKF